MGEELLGGLQKGPREDLVFMEGCLSRFRGDCVAWQKLVLK